MTVKSVSTFALVAFVIVSVVFLVAKESRRLTAGPASAPGPSAPIRTPGGGAGSTTAPHTPVRGHKVIAYYFHGNFRCVSCVKIETLSRKVVSEGFPDEIRSGRVEFRKVNIDEPQNRHFIDDYRLSSKSLVIVELRDGRQVRWRNLERVWTLLDSEQEFAAYVRDGVSGFLRSA